MGYSSSTPTPFNIVKKLVSHTPKAHAPTTHVHEQAIKHIKDVCKKDPKADICKFVNPKK